MANFVLATLLGMPCMCLSAIHGFVIAFLLWRCLARKSLKSDFFSSLLFYAQGQGDSEG